MGTWISPDQNTTNQIDYVLINKKKMDLIEDILTMRGPSIDSDHFLVKTILKQKLPLAYKKKPTPNTRWNKNAFKDTTKIRQYKTEIHRKLIELPETQEINKDWEEVKNAIIEAANKIIKNKINIIEKNGGMKKAGEPYKKRILLGRNTCKLIQEQIKNIIIPRGWKQITSLELRKKNGLTIK
jgi:hypothetical protein